MVPVFFLFLLSLGQGVPVLGIDVSIPATAFHTVTDFGGQVTALGGVGRITFSSVPAMDQIQGLNLAADTGKITTNQHLWSLGDFGPFSFIVTDGVANVAVSKPFVVTVGTNFIQSTHFHGAHQCEIGVFCVVKQQTCCGSPVVWDGSLSSGQLPPGLMLDPASGEVRGTPTGPLQSAQLVLRANIGSPVLRIGIDFSIQVVAPLRIDMSFMQPTCDVGFPFDSHLAWTGGPVIEAQARNPTPSLEITILSGSLPPGVSFAQSVTQTGSYQVPRLVGTPTRAGNFSVTLLIKDYLGGNVTVPYSVQVVAPASIDASGVSLIGEEGIPYVGPLVQSGGTAPRYWFFPQGCSGAAIIGGECSALPPGMRIENPHQGQSVMKGTPTGNGTFEMTLIVQPYYLPNATSQPVVVGAAVGRNVTLTIYSKLLLPVSVSSQAQEGVSFSNSFSASGGVPGSHRFAVEGVLPSGLAMDANSGVLSGSSTQVGTFAFVVAVTDQLGARSTTNAVLTVIPNGSLSVGAIAGIAVGSLIAVAVAIALTVALYKKWNASRVALRAGGSDETPYQLMNYKF
jgi:hypothetical protein